MKKIAFLDRDGPINVDHSYVGKIEDWQFAEGAIEGMKLLQDSGYTLAIVTNQSGIARGHYTVEDMQTLHEYMLEELKKEGISIAHIAYCPHDRDSTCNCRKPRTGMMEEIEEAIGPVDYANSWVVGDKIADIEMGKAKDVHTALLLSRYWKKEELTREPDFIASSLLQAARYIVGKES